MAKTKVKMLTGIAGLANPDYDLPEHSYAPQQEVEVDAVLAQTWIDSGLAVAIMPEKAPEKEKTPSKPSAPAAAKVVPMVPPAAGGPNSGDAAETGPAKPESGADAGPGAGLKTDEEKPAGQRTARDSRRS